MRARITENVKDVHVDVGTEVTNGQMLVEFRRADLLAATAARKTALKEAKANYSRFQKLYTEGHVTPQQLDRVQTALEDARAALRNAESDLLFTRVTAPFDGIISARMVDPGEFKKAGNPLLRVVGLSNISIRVQVPETAVTGLAAGMPFAFRPEGRASWRTVKVSRIRPATDNPNRFFEVFADIRNTRTHGAWRLRPGMYVHARFPVRSVPSAMAVPKAAVKMRQDRNVLYLVETAAATNTAIQQQAPGKTTRLQQAAVELGLRKGDDVRILKPELTTNDRVVLHPTDDLKDGLKVRVQPPGSSNE